MPRQESSVSEKQDPKQEEGRKVALGDLEVGHARGGFKASTSEMGIPKKVTVRHFGVTLDSTSPAGGSVTGTAEGWAGAGAEAHLKVADLQAGQKAARQMYDAAC